MLTGRSKSEVVLAPLDHAVSLLLVSSLFIAINGALLLFLSFLLYAIPIDVRLLLAFFLVVFSVYSINKMTDLEEDAINLPYRTRFVVQHRRAITVAVLGAVSSALLLALSQSFYAMLVISFPLVTGFLYSAGIFGFRLKNIKGLKSIVVGMSWALVAAMLPLAVTSRGGVEVLLVFWFFFVKMFINATVFDIRDIDGDVVQGVTTLPACLGKDKTRSVLLVINSSLVLWLGYSYLSGFFYPYLLLLVILIAYGYWYVLHFCHCPTVQRPMDLMIDGEWLLVITAIIPIVFR